MNNTRRSLMIILRRFSDFVGSDPDLQTALRLLISEKSQDVDQKPDVPEAAIQAEGHSTTCDTDENITSTSEFFEPPTTSAVYTHPDVSRIAPPSTFDQVRNLADRLRLKAEGSRWAMERAILSANGATHRLDIAPKDRDIVEKARLMNEGCDLWMNRPSFAVPVSLDSLNILAEWFDVTADSIELAIKSGMTNETQVIEVEDLLPLVAEAQFGLRVAVHNVSERADADQLLLQSAIFA